MKTFVLATIAVALTPAALPAQVLFPASPNPAVDSADPGSIPQVNVELPAESSPSSFTAERVPLPPRPDYKMRVVPPPDEPRARMRIARPDDDYDYKIQSWEGGGSARENERPRRERRSGR